MVLNAGNAAGDDPWTEFCLQQADRILLVAAGGEPSPLLAGRHELRRCELVAYDVAPGARSLDAWAATLDPIETHVLRPAELDDDIARTARRLAGRSVGIVLSGGGARAFSHIGVLEELTAGGVVIDRVAGVSMGAFVGGLFAMGLDADEIDARCFEEWVQRRPLSDYTFPRHALIRGERARAMLERTFGDVAIEELARSFMSGATELRSGRLEVARWGPLYEAIGFSLCLPIVAPPQVRGREMFIDGSLVDNLPVGLMAGLGEGPVIAVDVKASLGHAEGRPSVGRRRCGRRASPRRSRGCCCSAARTRPRPPTGMPTSSSAPGRRGSVCSSSTRSTKPARRAAPPPARRWPRCRSFCSPRRNRDPRLAGGGRAANPRRTPRPRSPLASGLVKELHTEADLIDAYDAAVIGGRARRRSSRSTRRRPGSAGCWAAGSGWRPGSSSRCSRSRPSAAGCSPGRPPAEQSPARWPGMRRRG